MKTLFLAMILAFLLFGAPAPAARPGCPAGGIASQEGDAPVFYARVGEHRLLVCGSMDESKPSPVYSEFDVFSLRRKVYSKALFTASALDHFHLRTAESGLDFLECVPLKIRLKNGYRTSCKNTFLKRLACDSETCRIQPDKCVFEKSKPFDTDALKKVKPWLSRTPPEGSVDESLIEELLRLALTGEPAAIRIFRKGASLPLEGGAAEAFTKAQTLLQRLKQAGCL